MANPALLCLVLLLAISAFGKLVHSPEGHRMRESLGVPPDAKGVLILGQAAHLDWDWLNFFSTNVNNVPPDHSGFEYWNPDPLESSQPTDTIFAEATKLLAQTPGKYGYHVCEMGFLQRFAQDEPLLWEQMKSFNPSTFSIVGGGMTSPDNLLPHGEAFLRNFLSGMSFLRSENVSWSGTVWMPDDFGHDSQLPVLMEAMGVRAVSFSRLPAGCQQGQDNVPAGFTSAHRVLLDPATGGLNFNWEGNDASNVFTYYVPQGYCCGDSLDDLSRTKLPNSPSDAALCQNTISASTPVDRMRAWYNVRAPVSPTPYMYVATGCDFGMPRQGMIAAVDDWNANVFPKNGVYAISSQFDKFAFLVSDYLQQNSSASIKTRNFHGSDSSTVFRPTPYWTGFYASRAALKQGQYLAVKTLQATETFALLARRALKINSASQAQIDGLWMDLAPSTHHDFITGTATDYVYEGEQLPLLAKVQQSAQSVKDSVLKSIVNKVTEDLPDKENGSGVFVFNQNGFPVSGQIVEFTVEDKEQREQLLAECPQVVQEVADKDGVLAALFDAPSLGYRSYSNAELIQLSKNSDGSKAVKTSVSLDGNSVTLENEFVAAVISKPNNWALVSLVDKKGGKKNILKKGNALSWRYDGGNIYRYGFEEGCGFDLYDSSIVASPAQLVERGPIRSVVRVVLTMSASQPSFIPPQNYTIEYTLVKDEPFVRINVTGAAAGTSAVITSFQFNSNINNYTHGTTYHWDWKQPFEFGKQQDFKVTMEATHDFVGVQDGSGNYQGAVYHVATPSWGVIGDSLYGVLMRNSPGGTPGCNGYGADGTDTETHSIIYAIRVPSSFDHFSARQEAIAFNTPLTAVAAAGASSSSYSLASVQSSSNVIITALKAGTFDADSAVLRLYNPSNAAVNVLLSATTAVSNGSQPFAITALEVPIQKPTRFISAAANGTKINLNRAVTTLMFP